MCVTIRKIEINNYLSGLGAHFSKVTVKKVYELRPCLSCGKSFYNYNILNILLKIKQEVFGMYFVLNKNGLYQF